MTRRNPEAGGPYELPEEWPGWREIRERWRAALCDPSRPPTDEPVWVWCEGIGWLRRKEGRAK